MALHPIRSLLYALLLMFSIIMLGLTAYQIHLTKSSVNNVLTGRSHYYDPIVVALLVTSILTLLWSLWMLSVLLARIGAGGITSYAMELSGLFILWVMFLVCAAIFTNKFLHLKGCRGLFRICRVLETIKAFSWICFIFLTFLILLSLFNMRSKRHGPLGPAHGRSDIAVGSAAYPQARETKTARGTGVTTHDNHVAPGRTAETHGVNGNTLPATHQYGAGGGPGVGNVQQPAGTNIV